MRQFRPSLKHIVIGGLGSSIGLVGIVCAVALYVVEVIIHDVEAEGPRSLHVYPL